MGLVFYCKMRAARTSACAEFHEFQQKQQADMEELKEMTVAVLEYMKRLPTLHHLYAGWEYALLIPGKSGSCQDGWS